MSVNVKTILKSPLMAGACITATVTIAGTLYAVTHPRSMVNRAESAQTVQAKRCKTVVFDAKPPLNVRDTPVERAGNIVASLDNGEILTVVAEREGWLQISAPTAGWVYQNLTRETCDNDLPAAALSRKRTSDPNLATLPSDEGSRLYRESVSQFQAGNLTGAIALAKAVSADSAAYPQAQIALKTMPQTWNQAEAKYSNAREAAQQSRWSDILQIVAEYPDIRFWREKLTPIVKQAIQNQGFAALKEAQ